MEASWNLPITDQSQVGEARRIASALASSLLFNETDSGKIALIVTEMATNILRHAAGRGEILLRSVHDENGTGVEVLGVDQGAGMSNISACMEDGFSTAGSAGIGLGGIRRLSGAFDIDSIPGRGTCILSRIYRTHSMPVQSQLPRYEFGVVAVPHPQERACGDGYFLQQDNDVCTMMVVDGLGHGIMAAEASRKACRLLQEHGHQPLEDLLNILHQGLRGSRGAAVGIARIDPEHGDELRFLGVGNISGTLLQPDGSSKSVMSYPGIVGHEMRKAKEMRYPWNPRTTVILHSDGLQTQWDAKSYPRALHADTSILAATLYRDFNRGRDDVTVMAVKAKPQRGFQR